MKVVVVIPNWNGAKDLPVAIDSVLAQSFRDFDLIVVDNGSTDKSRDIIESYQARGKHVRSIYLDKNYGYTGGVNPGMELAIKEDADFVAPFNNDAKADRDWLKNLVEFLRVNPKYGIAACTMLHMDGRTIDSTADQYTIWGLPFPRGRGEPALKAKSYDTEIFGASGGASMYRVEMLKEVGIFDQDFFAYYEDIDLSFRAQLAGWKVAFVPSALVYHSVGQTTKRLSKGKGRYNSFATKQHFKNLPFVVIKDIPTGLLIRIWPRFMLVYTFSLLKALAQGRGGSALAGVFLHWIKFPKKLWQRRQIQKGRKVSNKYLWTLLIHDLPPNSNGLGCLHVFWRRLTHKP